MSRWLPFVLVVLVWAPASADEVHLHDGTTVEGKVILRKKDGPVFVQLANKGLRVLQREQVREVVAEESPLTYVRFHRYHPRWARLEVLTRTLRSEDGRTVSLVGAVHVGDTRYYRRLQRILDKHDAVLYEGVGPNQDRDLASAELPDAEQRQAELAEAPAFRNVTWTDASRDSTTMMQLTMADSLDLTFQSNGVDYSHSWWFSADVTVDELKGLFDNGQDAAMLQALTAGFDPKLTQHMNAMVGRALAEGAKGVLQDAKPLALVLKEACADLLASQFGQEPGVSPQERVRTDMDKALILGRNRVVMQRFKEMANHPSAKSIAIFYGAAHNPDLETQLHELGYTPVKDEWLPAWVMEPPAEAR